ncbi:MAG: DUF4019 domain-containing protein [Pontixanthobacter sp.]
MSHGYQALTEKEKQTLRLILRGHDAKSMARKLDISVHTVNERLRHARRKLDVSSSRGAARMLLAKEGAADGIEDPQSYVPEELGDAPAGVCDEYSNVPNVGQRGRQRPVLIIGGIAIMSIIAASLALVLAPTLTTYDPVSPPELASTTEAVTEIEIENTAREWIALVDAANWEESWTEAGSTFRAPNTLESWTDISEAVRTPLGDVLSRETGNQVDVPAPPTGYRVIQFRTSFANKTAAIETVSLERENGEWRVVGYYIA